MTMAKMKVLGDSGILAKIGKRNLILICAVLFIGLAVYLNYMWFSDAAEPTGNIGYGENNNLTSGTEAPEDENVSDTTDTCTSIRKATNHAGGILGGISDGSDIVFRVAVKPTPSVSAEQSTVNKSGEEITVSVTGRHDPVIVPRAVVVVEAMAALTIADALLVNMSAKLDNITEFYK